MLTIGNEMRTEETKCVQKEPNPIQIPETVPFVRLSVILYCLIRIPYH